MSDTAAAASPTVRVSSAQSSSSLGWGAIALYNAPTLGFGCTYLLVNLYLMKYATDVLLVSAGAMGVIFLLSRLWDAVVDTLAGYLSDRTKSRMGRRRPWLLASAFPIAISFALMWQPPTSLGPSALALWMGVCVILYYSSTTLAVIPHTSLGAELSDQYHERTRIFGARHAGWTLGSLLAVGGMAALIAASDPRARAVHVSSIVAIVTALLIVWMVVSTRERPEYQGRGEPNPLKAFGDVWRNRHARLLFFVFLIESLGGATITVLTPYVADYILGMKDMTAQLILFYMIPSLLFVPLSIWLSRRMGKRRLWVISLFITAGGFGAMIFVGQGDFWLIAALATVLGIGNACGSVVSPSMQADVIDFDELETGQRKEGAYTAAWNFVFKTATGITVMLTGVILETAGYQANQAQSDSALFAMRALYSLFPMTCYAIGALLLMRFRLDEAEHTRIRAALDARKAT